MSSHVNSEFPVPRQRSKKEGWLRQAAEMDTGRLRQAAQQAAQADKPSGRGLFRQGLWRERVLVR
jgi:hypothetical protein